MGHPSMQRGWDGCPRIHLQYRAAAHVYTVAQHAHAWRKQPLFLAKLPGEPVSLLRCVYLLVVGSLSTHTSTVLHLSAAQQLALALSTGVSLMHMRIIIQDASGAAAQCCLFPCIYFLLEPARFDNLCKGGCCICHCSTCCVHARFLFGTACRIQGEYQHCDWVKLQ